MSLPPISALNVLTLLSVFSFASGVAQISSFPHMEDFDSVSPPALPPGWSSSQNRTPGTNDFTTSTTTPHSLPMRLAQVTQPSDRALRHPGLIFPGRFQIAFPSLPAGRRLILHMSWWKRPSMVEGHSQFRPLPERPGSDPPARDAPSGSTCRDRRATHSRHNGQTDARAAD